MTVREATVDDAEAIQRVARASWHAGYDDILGPETVEQLLDMRYHIDPLEDLIRSEQKPVLVSVEDGEVVGFVQAEPSEYGVADAGVRKLYVVPERWGEGHGTALLEEVFDVLRAHGHESVWVAVLADNDVALPFYDKHGFELEEERTIDLMGNEYDDVLLVRDLDEGSGELDDGSREREAGDDRRNTPRTRLGRVWATARRLLAREE